MGPSLLREGFLSHHHYYHSQLIPEAVVAIPISRTTEEECGHRRCGVRAMSSSSPLAAAAAAARMVPHASCSTNRISSCNGLPQSRGFPRPKSGFRHQLLQNDGPHSNSSSIRCTIEPREFVGGIRKIAPLLESGLLPKELDSVPKDSTEWKAIPDIWKTTAEKFGDRVALSDPHRDPPVEVTYKQLEQSILDFAEGLRVYGIRPNETVALISDNSHRWLIADQGIMAAGATNAVRGSRSATEELVHIIKHSDSVALVVDSPEVYNRVASRLMPDPNLKFVVVLWGDTFSLKDAVSDEANDRLPIYAYDEVLKSGKVSRQALAAANNSADLQYEVIRPDDVASIVYTSGTSGNPKGVMLTHANLLHQVTNLTAVLQPQPGHRFLSLLPPWHMYERSAEYFALSLGVVQVYTSVLKFKEDLVTYPPDFFVAVPLVFDILYNGVQRKLAQGSTAKKMIAMALINVSLKFMDLRRIYKGRDLSHARYQRNALISMAQWLGASILALVLLPIHLLAKKIVYSKILGAITIKQAAITGGGSISSNVDKFFEAIGLTVLNGYGLTETSPVISARLRTNNVLGSVGWPIPETEIKVVDPETDAIQPPGTTGVVKIRGPQVMKGYYKNPAATKKAIDVNGWFDTGDLGWIAPKSHYWGGGRLCAGALVLDGRAKDTIVLKTGENVEPTQVEEVALQSPFVQQIVVVGQDQRRLGALIVVDKEHPSAASLSEDDLKDAVRLDLRKRSADMQFPIGPFSFVDEPFTVENGLLTPTLKIRRDIIVRQYKAQIEALFTKDRVQN